MTHRQDIGEARKRHPHDRLFLSNRRLSPVLWGGGHVSPRGIKWLSTSRQHVGPPSCQCVPCLVAKNSNGTKILKIFSTQKTTMAFHLQLPPTTTNNKTTPTAGSKCELPMFPHTTAYWSLCLTRANHCPGGNSVLWNPKNACKSLP